jgi:6-phosphogluconolactonase/glucosamine-6-phosphate isomerase/deaminase
MELSLRAYYPVLTEETLSLDACALRYETVLQTLVQTHARTIAIFGIGADDHIAGMLPESVAVREKSRLVVGYEAGTFIRITITPPFFSFIHTAYVYAQGEGKLSAVKRLADVYDVSTHPDQLLKCVPAYTVFYCSAS